MRKRRNEEDLSCCIVKILNHLIFYRSVLFVLLLITTALFGRVRLGEVVCLIAVLFSVDSNCRVRLLLLLWFRVVFVVKELI